MTKSWTFVLLLLHPIFTSTLPCNHTKDCECFDSEIQCPVFRVDAKEPHIVIHEGHKLKIDCYNFEEFHMDLLPNVVVESTKLEMSHCPVPVNGLKEILDHFSMTKVIEFEYCSANLTLTKKFFEGCSDFKKLILEDLDFVRLDEDVFSVIPSLTSLQMINIRNLTLVSSLFRNLTTLRALSLENNKLEAIPDGIFDPLVNLKVLLLSSNRLKTINDEIFSYLQNLTILELSLNEIGDVSEDSFQNLTQLTQINLSANKLANISRNIFKNNEKIEIVLFQNNPGLQPPDYFFANRKNLQRVDLSYCNLSTIPEHIFENSTNLTILKLQNNKLEFLSPRLFRRLANLKELDLSQNLITSLEKITFEDLTGLERVNFRKNRIRTIDNYVFSNKEKLSTVILSYNLYSKDDTGSILQESTSVSKLDLSHNLITRVDEVISPFHVSNLEELDLSHNLITEISLKDLQPSKDMYAILDDNNITRIDFENVEHISASGTTWISLDNNPLNCDCHSYKLFQFLQDKKEGKMFEIETEDLICASPPELTNQSFSKLSPFLMLCPVEDKFCPSNCLCSICPHSESFIVDCSFKNFTHFPTLNHETKAWFSFNHTELNLEGNNLKTGPRGDWEGYYNITELNLSKNQIKKIDWLPPKLKVLHLDNNELSYLNSAVLKTLEALDFSKLTLGVNPWTCDCVAVNFTNFLRQHPESVDVADIKCHKASTLLLNLSEKELCPDKLLPYIVVPLLVLFLLLTTFLVLFYRYQEAIKIWLFAHNCCLCWVSEEELDKDKTYDAFISYCQKDEDFVVQNLLPVLEGGQNPYKLCVHYRDWIPGLMITTQITSSVLDSRRTLVVLSKNFLESIWGKMEFRTAHTHAMTEGRARVIIVLYGDIDVDKLDDELKTYLKTNTYVKWGDPYFWNKLKYALPHSRGKLKTNEQKIANAMRCIEDKLTFMVEDKADSITTPPVLALNGDNLKKHPLSFVPSQEISTPPAESGTLIISTH